MAEAQLAQALPNLLSPDAATRQAAEQAIEQIKGQPAAWFPAILSLARGFPEPQMRQMAAVVLRKSISKDPWTAAGLEAQTVVKAGLLEAVFPETQHLVRKALGDVISKLAAVASQADVCPAILLGKSDR
eukprot:387335-Rhodomonas_salina.1